MTAANSSSNSSLNKEFSQQLNSDHDSQKSLLVEQFKTLFRMMCAEDLQLDLMSEVYDKDLTFQDSFHKIESRQAFSDYCAELYKNLKACEFDFHQQWISEGEAMLTWTMTYSHSKLNRGRDIVVNGASHIRFDKKIYFHQDYFDGGALLYEHLPVLGTIIQQIKKHMA